MKRSFLQAGKALISLCLLGWFFTLVEPRAVLEIFSLAALGPLFLAMLTMLAGLLVSVYKWRVLLSCDGIVASFTRLVRYYLIGIYCNNFLPTSIGGDAMRAWLVSSRYEKGLTALSSVLAERLSGLLALLLVAGLCSLGGDLFPEQTWLGLLLLVSLAVICLLAGKMGQDRLLSPLPVRFRDKVAALLSALHRYCVDRRSFGVMGWTSLSYPFLVGLVYFWAGRAIAVHVPFFDLVVISSLVTLLTLIPVSLNGLGLREGGFVFFLGQSGVPQAQALSLSLLVFGLTLLFSLTGGVCLLFERGTPKRAQ